MRLSRLTAGFFYALMDSMLRDIIAFSNDAKCFLQMSRTLPKQIESMDPALADVLRAKTPAEKIEMVAAASRTARLLAAAGARLLHPDWNDVQIQAEVIRRVSSGSK